MTVVIVKPGYAPYEADINGLDEMQKVVGGIIQAIYPFEDNAAVVCNDEGLFLDLPFNRSVPGGYGGVFGNFFVCGLGEEDFCSLTPEQVKAYAFTRYQNDALDELLADRVALASLASSLTITNADAAEVLQNLPDDLSPERRAVVQNALTLYGKVSYFWGGKSLVLGWDSRWGQLRQVTAAGSSTTGTYRPYGLDCSGFVDWAFYNATGGSYIIGHGGGATMQHGYCTDISWQDAQPGDLVFYPDNSHVGIICGRDETGKLLVIHCASGANNVVITGTSGFVSVARPEYYGE